ncbi:MAG: CHAT domain-containing protein [Thermaceae bacterium]|nr:CHAT domain-containing protein [Thermaceae bacterium]
MHPETAVQFLLTEPEPQARAEYLAAYPPDIGLIEALKAQVDRYKDTDSALALLAGERAAEAAAYVDDPRAQPLGEWALALGLTVRGDFTAAIPHYEQARARFTALGLSEEAARAAVRQVQALAMMGDLSGARELAEQTREVFLRLGLLRDAANVGINLGIILSRLGRIPEAEAALRGALEGLLAIGDELGVAKAHSNLGQLYQQQDRLSEAVGEFETALEIFRQRGQVQLEAGTSLNLALLYRKEGRLTAALGLLDRVRQTYGDQAHPDAVFAGLEEARTYLELNLLDEAERLAEELVGTFAQRRMELEQAEALVVLGLAQAKAHRLGPARARLEQAEGLWKRLGNRLQAALTGVYIANLRLQEGRNGDWSALEAAVLGSARAAADLTEMPSAKALGLSIMAESLLEMGNPSRARLALEEAAALLSGLEVPGLQIRLEGLLGRAALPADPEAAEAHFKRAVALLEGVRSGLGVDEFRTAYLGDKLDAYANLVDLLLDAHRDVEAFEYAERAKSRALVELLAARGEQEEPQETQNERLEQELVQARSWLDRLLLEEGAFDRDRQARVAEAENRVLRLLRELERQGRSGLAPLSQIGLEEFQKVCPPDMVLLEYFSTARGLVAFVLEGQALRGVRELGSLAEITQALERLEFFLHRVAQGEPFAQIYGEEVLQASVNEQLRALHRLLLEPLNLSLEGRSLLVVPHGVLHRVPFAALLGERGYLLDQAEVSLAPSAALYTLWRRRKGSPKGPLVAFGVPLEGLPQATEEVEAIARIARQAHKFTGAAASMGHFFDQAETAQVLHLATHGVFRPDNPMFSGLRLSDGWLTARDLYRLRLRAELVVLSACETGVSTPVGGDELLGLARGFLFAGAPCLVASLWPVRDEVTALLMAEFYRHLQAGATVSSALRTAQQTLRKAYPNPYYWAAFGITGDAERRVSI